MEYLHDKWLRLWFFWIVAIALGSPRTGNTIVEFLTSRIYVSYYSPLFILFFALFFLSSGGFSGIAQWLILRNHLEISGWLWIFTTILESIISIYLLDVDIASSFAAFILYSGVIGLLIGSLQWLILRRRINHAGWWIFILIAGRMVSAVFVIVIVTLFRSTMFYIDLLSPLLYGALTGAGLIALLVQSSKEKMLAGFNGSTSQIQ